MRVLTPLLAIMLLAAPVHGQVRSGKVLTYDGVKLVMAAAEQEAARLGVRVTIAIVDPGGHILMVHRLDGAHPGGVGIALGKAKTAANFRQPTKRIEDSILAGKTTYMTIEGLVPLQGGLPIRVDGEVLGAIGVSGATSQQDEDIAAAGVQALVQAVGTGS